MFQPLPSRRPPRRADAWRAGVWALLCWACPNAALADPLDSFKGKVVTVDGGTAALINALAPPPPPRHALPAGAAAGGPAAPTVEDPPWGWITASALSIALIAALAWGASEFRRRKHVADELSRMKAYLATLNKQPRVTPSTRQAEANAAREAGS